VNIPPIMRNVFADIIPGRKISRESDLHEADERSKESHASFESNRSFLQLKPTGINNRLVFPLISFHN